MDFNTDTGDSPVVFPPDLIKRRIVDFWGYGDFQSTVWLLGMEEGCDGSIPKLISRFKKTQQRALLDIVKDMESETDHLKWFQENAPTQSTYRKLIYLLRYIQRGNEPTLEEIRDYQIHHFGRKGNDHAVLELMPLPARSLREQDWVYKGTTVDGLASRRAYLKQYKPERINGLRSRIAEYHPNLVICFSMVYLPDWKAITDASFTEVIPRMLHIAKDEHTAFAIVPHAVAHKVTNADWRSIAEKIMEELPSSSFAPRGSHQ